VGWTSFNHLLARRPIKCVRTPLGTVSFSTRYTSVALTLAP
jgi:hypothetical protein